ncbi:MAG: alpha/beta fold hydrolase [Oceanococcus sp.]
MNWAQWQSQAQSYKHNGHNITYWQAGNVENPTLLLIHGFPTASADWLPLWPALSQHFRLLAVDMMGFGYSAKPREYNYSIIDQADLLQQVTSACGITHCHVLAHDYGDTVAQELLARHLDAGLLRLDSLCLLNGGLFPETHRATFTQKLLHSPIGRWVAGLMNRQRFERNFSAVFGAKTQPRAEELAQYWAQVDAGEGSQGIAHLLIRYITERRQNRLRWVGALERSDIPMRVVCGADDPVSGAHMAQRYRELIAQPDVVLLDGIGHYPQCEHPQAVLKAFLDFHALPVSPE